MGTAKKKKSERYYLNSSCRLAAVFVDEFGDEEDVMGAGENREGENGRVNRWEIVAGGVGETGGEHDCRDCQDLDGGIDFAEH